MAAWSKKVHGALAVALAATALVTGCGRMPTGIKAAAKPDLMQLQARGLSRISDEESALMSQGLLPANYPALVEAMATGGVEAARTAAREGLKGPFADDFGDPRAQLKAARFAKTHPEYGRLLHNVKRGDLVFIATNEPDDFVNKLSGGPFDHVLLCVDPEAPGQYLEACGITGEAGDTMGDRVRRASLARYAGYERITFRVLHPAASHPATIDPAIAFCEQQLGKPYNYTFSDQTAGDRAFYCSSLVYLAYKHAGLQWRPAKNPVRDRVAMALMKPVLALQPTDALALSVKLMALLHQDPGPSMEALANFFVREVLPNCKRTANIAMSEPQKQHLAAALAQLLQGQGFPLFAAAMADYHKAEASGAFKVPVLGAARRAAFQARLAEDCARDAGHLVATSDINTWSALNALRAVLGAALPYADALAAYSTGTNSGATKSAAHFLDMLDAFRQLVPHWGNKGFGPGDLPGRAPWVVDDDLESPTDLAWSVMPHEDYNRIQGSTVDPPYPFAVVPDNNNFGQGAVFAEILNPLDPGQTSVVGVN